MNYPLQAMVQLGVVPPVTFPTDSRYYGSARCNTTGAKRAGRSPTSRDASCLSPERPILRRSTSTPYTQGDRLDLIAAKYLGDPLMAWLICDANGAIRPHELVATPGRVLAITMPQGVPGGSVA